MISHNKENQNFRFDENFPIPSHDLALIKKEISVIKNASTFLDSKNSITKFIIKWVMDWPEFNSPKYLGISLAAGTSFRNYIRNKNTKKLFEKSAWDWLCPIRCRSLDELKSIQKDHFLDHLPENEFLKTLREQLLDMCENYKILSNWIMRRIAVLDYKIEKHISSLPLEINDLLINLEIEQRDFLWVVPEIIKGKGRNREKQIDKIEQQLVRLLDTILDAAGQTVLSALGKNIASQNNSKANVNIMFPVNVDKSNHRGFFGEIKDLELLNEIEINNSNATEIWEKTAVDYEKILVIAFQSKPNIADHSLESTQIIELDPAIKSLKNNDNRKVGFWLPIDPSVYGAAEAFCNKQGAIVIRDDLKYHEKQERKLWKPYIKNNVKEPAFFSIPCIVPNHERPGITERLPIAILNVDFSPNDKMYMYRGYYDGWQERARDSAQSFIILAYHTYTLLSILRPNKYYLDIATDLEKWDRFAHLPYIYKKNIHKL